MRQSLKRDSISSLRIAREMLRQRKDVTKKTRQYGIPLTVRFPDELYIPLIKSAMKYDTSASEIVRNLVANWVAKWDKKLAKQQATQG